MIELAWFVAGAAAAGMAAAMLSRRRAERARAARGRRRTATRKTALPADTALRPAPVPPDARHLALTLAEELATLVSGIEGRTHHLVDAAPDRRQLPAAAEGLLRAVQRLRTLHTKLVAFGRARTARHGTTDVASLVASLRDELQQMQLGLEFCWEPPVGLPRVAGAPDVVRDALLFLCAALLRAERGATHLAIHAEPCFAGDSPRVQIEVALEWVAEAEAPVGDLLTDPSFTLDLEAANNLITGLGGDVSVSHLPGRSVRAVVRWPADVREAPEVELVPTSTTAAHSYGGALLLEADPLIRAMVASELKAAGRAVFACADVASAKSLLEATPDRFELLIVDHHQRIDGDPTLLGAIQRLTPGLKICVLSPDTSPARDPARRVHCIQKPFGVHELRRALATVLAG